jgi:hypothetical protein
MEATDCLQLLHHITGEEIEEWSETQAAGDRADGAKFPVA